MLLPYADSHTHILSLARMLREPDCGPAACPTVEALLDVVRVAQQSENPRTWIVMRGFDDMLLRDGRLPRTDELDAVCSSPLRIRHRTGHASLLNTAAFEALPSLPWSARIEPDVRGAPVLLIGAERWLNTYSGQPAREDMVAGLQAVARHHAQAGIGRVWDTTPRDARSAAELSTLVRECAASLELRFMLDAPSGPAAAPCHYVKLFPEQQGARLGERVDAAHAHGCPVAIHVATEAELEAALGALEGSRACDWPDRLEHVPLVGAAHAGRIAALGAVVVTHPGWLHSRRDKYRRTLSETERARLFPFRMLVEEGVELVFASDAPIELPDPALWMSIATGREDGQAISAQVAAMAARGGSLWADAPACRAPRGRASHGARVKTRDRVLVETPLPHARPVASLLDMVQP